MRLERKFFNRNTVAIAKELLGKYLCRRIPSTSSGQVARVIKAKITETEAYCGPKDRASHASKGPAWPAGRLTPRTRLMFGPSGYAYVYMIYGMYYCLNVVTEREGYPAAVLIRTAKILNKSKILNPKIQKLKGPGILCRELRIDKKLNGIDLATSKELWVEDSAEKINQSKIRRGKRIGVDYAGQWKDKLWRFYF